MAHAKTGTASLWAFWVVQPSFGTWAPLGPFFSTVSCFCFLLRLNLKALFYLKFYMASSEVHRLESVPKFLMKSFIGQKASSVTSCPYKCQSHRLSTRISKWSTQKFLNSFIFYQVPSADPWTVGIWRSRKAHRSNDSGPPPPPSFFSPLRPRRILPRHWDPNFFLRFYFCARFLLLMPTPFHAF